MEQLREALSAKFKESELLWRAQRTGFSNGKPWAMVLCYVDARAIMERLDNVMGVANWKDEYRIDTHGAVCRLSLRVDNEWIAKENCAEQTDVEGYKGQVSKAFVRTAVNWGIGRYLYDLEENFAFCQEAKPASKSGWHKVYDKAENKTWYWQDPKLPDWALPKQLPK